MWYEIHWHLFCNMLMHLSHEPFILNTEKFISCIKVIEEMQAKGLFWWTCKQFGENNPKWLLSGKLCFSNSSLISLPTNELNEYREQCSEPIIHIKIYCTCSLVCHFEEQLTITLHWAKGTLHAMLSSVVLLPNHNADRLKAFLWHKYCTAHHHYA